MRRTRERENQGTQVSQTAERSATKKAFCNPFIWSALKLGLTQPRTSRSVARYHETTSNSREPSDRRNAADNIGSAHQHCQNTYARAARILLRITSKHNNTLYRATGDKPRNQPMPLDRLYMTTISPRYGVKGYYSRFLPAFLIV